MIETEGNLWSGSPGPVYSSGGWARVITTNGTVKRNGDAVMGAGCAKEARTTRFHSGKYVYPNLARRLGKMIFEDGNHVYCLQCPGENAREGLFSFPVKHNWWERADLELIKRSAYELVKQTNLFALRKVVVPRPGCGNGNLRWEDVRPVLEPIFDDRFYVITYKESV